MRYADSTGRDSVLLPCSATGCQIPEGLSRVLSGVEADPERAASWRLSADHTPWSSAANLPLKGDLGARILVYPSSLSPTQLLFLYAQGAAPAEFWTCLLGES